jgi:putative PIN family toxin of toxin-antitoxin system
VGPGQDVAAPGEAQALGARALRAILDTNVLLSALIRVDSKPYKLVRAWLDGRFGLVSGEAQLEELRRVSRYEQVRRYFAPAEIGWLINRIRERALLVKQLPKVDVADDPGDNYLLAMAVAGEAEYLVTGDKSDLLALERHRGTQLVTVQEMVSMLKLR